MLGPVNANRRYDPETAALMAAAFDRACHCLSARMDGRDEVKRTLALIILRHADQGERDPERLADAALRELQGSDRAATLVPQVTAP
jgi:hypothetical protein